MSTPGCTLWSRPPSCPSLISMLPSLAVPHKARRDLARPHDARHLEGVLDSCVASSVVMSDLIPAKLDSGSMFSGALFDGARVDGMIADKEFDSCHFQSCSFQEATMRDCTFRNCSFTGCNMALLQVPGTQFQDVVFRESKIIGVDWTQCRLPSVGGAFLFKKNCVLNDSFFVGLKLKNGVFLECIAHDVDFSEADLTNCDFSGTDLQGARFNHTLLRGARLGTALNYSINLLTNEVVGAEFSLPEAGSLLEVIGIKLVDGAGNLPLHAKNRDTTT